MEHRADRQPPLLSVRDLRVTFQSGKSQVRAVNGVSFDLWPGEHLGLVGESGSGKSATALSIVGLLPIGAESHGSVRFGGTELLNAPEKRLQAVRGAGIGMIYQDPFSALNPVLTIERQLTEAVGAHKAISSKAATSEAVSLLELVGVPDAAKRIRNYPHQFSGGMRQRVMIAMALAGDPQLMLADEPTTALDVTTQAQILELLVRITGERGMALVLITHDLGVVARIAHRVNVMYAGRMVETGAIGAVFADSGHPYTAGLLGSLPRIDERSRRLPSISGQPPDMSQEVIGCAFAPRCARQIEPCLTDTPELRDVSAARGSGEPVGPQGDPRGHETACWNPPPAPPRTIA